MTDAVAVLRAVAPRANASFLAGSAGLGSIMTRYGITSPKAQCQVIAQTAHECAGFTRFEEGLSYSAERLCQVWPSRFPSVAAAQPFARNPKALANKVYNGRMGNRPGSDDGWDYRGSGPLQHTGASEFDRVERRTGLPVRVRPGMLRDPKNAEAMWHAACSYFVDRGALAAANDGNTELVTLRVNGGKIGLADRRLLVARAEAALGGQAIPLGISSSEDADVTKRKAQTATAAVPAGGAAGGGSSSTKADWQVAVAIGVTIAIAIGIVAVVLWRRWSAKQGAVDVMRLQTIEERGALQPA